MNTELKSRRSGTRVLGTFIDAGSWSSIVNKLMEWSKSGKHAAVCLCNVHSSVTALDDAGLSAALSSSEMVLPDGAPVAWTMRRKGYKDQTRIAGPDLMWKLCEAAARNAVPVFLFGSKPETLSALDAHLKHSFPKLDIRGSLSPRFGQWTDEEEAGYIDTIIQSGARIVFVGLGCPKQEIWMSNTKHRIDGVLLGVGAAFDFHAGIIKRAPLFYQRMGLEWAHRLTSDPLRLWKRYLFTNSRFLLHLPATLHDTQANAER